MNYLETATNCKMVYNASNPKSQHSTLNGKIEIQFTEITDALVTAYAWPDKIPSDSPTHGILENGHIYQPKFGSTIIAPTDWTIYV